ncbi:MAG: hypothetical protein IPM99_01745 [Rubrivivax sp.]|nr:hypothetical protein [Rubrivivax sp.]
MVTVGLDPARQPGDVGCRHAAAHQFDGRNAVDHRAWARAAVLPKLAIVDPAACTVSARGGCALMRAPSLLDLDLRRQASTRPAWTV